MDYNILIGGEAGQGVNTVESLIEKTIFRSGYFVFSNKDYMSRIRGGHNFDQIRFSHKPVTCHSSKLDVIIAFSTETIEIHKERLKETGIIICSSSLGVSGEGIITMPFEEMAREVGNSKVFSMIIGGLALKVFGLSLEKSKSVINQYFKDDIRESNLKAVEKGYTLGNVKFELEEPNIRERITINGNQATALGAIAAGCSFYSAYPMTPGTGIMNYIASKQKSMEIVVEQAEDEIAAINMVIGASFAGARAMTGTSGGGYSLMVEAIGLSGITETPAVIANVMRPGPATGLPTRTAQGDLKFVIHAAQDEFPRMIIALRDAQEAFYQTARAFNIADKYQIPVTILSDQYLADSAVTIEPFNFGKIKIERHIANEYEVREEYGMSLNHPNVTMYRRYRNTMNGISPRIIPGKIKEQVYTLDSDEHDEFGHIIEEADKRNIMMEKRMRKIVSLKQDIQEPLYFGTEKPKSLLVAWGSTQGVIIEAVEKLNNEGFEVGALVFGDVWPLPEQKLKEYSNITKRLISVEGNYSGQLADIIQEQTCIPIKERICRYDGRAWSIEQMYQKLVEVLNG